jgi:hypothetical protein
MSIDDTLQTEVHRANGPAHSVSCQNFSKQRLLLATVQEGIATSRSEGQDFKLRLTAYNTFLLGTLQRELKPEACSMVSICSEFSSKGSASSLTCTA